MEMCVCVCVCGGGGGVTYIINEDVKYTQLGIGVLKFTPLPDASRYS